MSKLKWVLQAYCLKHGILAKNEQGLAFCPDCMTEAEQYPPLATLAADKEALERVNAAWKELVFAKDNPRDQVWVKPDGPWRPVNVVAAERALDSALAAAHARGLLGGK